MSNGFENCKTTKEVLEHFQNSKRFVLTELYVDAETQKVSDEDKEEAKETHGLMASLMSNDDLLKNILRHDGQ